MTFLSALKRPFKPKDKSTSETTATPAPEPTPTPAPTETPQTTSDKMPTRVPLLFGTATFGKEGTFGVRNTELSECQGVLDTFFDAGYKELDSSRLYGFGSTENYLGQLNLRDAQIDSKAYPQQPGGLAPEKIRASLLETLKELKVKKVRAFYLHAPDRATPFEDQLREVDALYKEGLFEEFGLSNFSAWEVAEFVGIAKKNQWIKPTVYEAMYNGITRAIEPELVPCLRKNGIRLVVYNPLAGGFLTGKLSGVNATAEKGSRFDESTPMGKLFRARYLQANYVEALDHLKEVSEKAGLKMPEVALRWLQHHSILTEKDGVILGASSAAQLQANITDSEKGPLPQEVVDAMDEAWAKVGMACPSYWR